MGIVVAFKSFNTMGKVAFILLSVAQLLNWLSFCMADWGRYDTSVANDDKYNGIGVWRACNNNEPAPSCTELDGWRLDWFGAFQAFAIFGFVATNVSFILLILMMFVAQCIGNREVAIGSAVAAFVACVAYLIAVIIFGVEFDSTYDFGFDREAYASGFYFAIFILLLTLVAGILIIMGAKGGVSVAQDSGSSENASTKQSSSTKGTK